MHARGPPLFHSELLCRTRPFERGFLHVFVSEARNSVCPLQLPPSRATAPFARGQRRPTRPLYMHTLHAPRFSSLLDITEANASILYALEEREGRVIERRSSGSRDRAFSLRVLESRGRRIGVEGPNGFPMKEREKERGGGDGVIDLLARHKLFRSPAERRVAPFPVMGCAVDE